MSDLSTARDLKRDALFRVGEPITGASQWDAKALDYLNRSYRTLALGANEFLPEAVADWWWMRSAAVLTLEPMVEQGSVTVTRGSNAITFSTTFGPSLVGWHLRVDKNPDTFVIASNVAGFAAAILDSVYTNESGTFIYKLMKLRYTLAPDVTSLVGPMEVQHDNYMINGLAPERMHKLFPISKVQGGVPAFFALEAPRTVRFSAAGRTDGNYIRVEYRYKATVTNLEDSDTSIPLVPIEYRHSLSDMACAYLMMDKNDDRATGMAAAARSTLTAMAAENKRRIKTMDDNAGRIFPRAGDRWGREPLRTASGLIIG